MHRLGVGLPVVLNSRPPIHHALIVSHLLVHTNKNNYCKLVKYTFIYY